MAPIVEDEKEVKETKTSEGRRVVTLKKPGSKKTERLDHDSPSWMRSEEWKACSQLLLAVLLYV